MSAFPVRVVAAACALAMAAACAGSGPGVVADGSPATTAPPSAPATTVSPVPTTAPTPPTSPSTTSGIRTERGVVTRVVDGDTAHVRLQRGVTEKVRFIGVDTPESTIRHEPYGSQASAFAKKHLAGATVYLEYDLDLRDRYGRLLAYVWLRPPQDGGAGDVRSGMFNAVLLAGGYAQVATFPPNVRYVDVFRVIEREARAQSRGLWGLPG